MRSEWARTASLCSLLLVLLGGSSANGDDCNANGIDDGIDIAEEQSRDCDKDGVPDECGVHPGISFVTRELFRMGSRRHSGLEGRIKAADMDGDQDLDLVATSLANQEVSILENLGGRFGPSVDLSARMFVSGLDVGDIDGDGDIDIVAAEFGSGILEDREGRLILFSNDGVGHITPGPTFKVGRYPFQLTLGDVDGDADVDLLVGNVMAYDQVLPEGKPVYTIVIFQNRGKGEFGSPWPLVTPGGVRAQMILVDIDGDRDLDLLTTLWQSPAQNVFAVYENPGDGRFGEPRFLQAGPTPGSFEIDDFDGDGSLDIAVGSLDVSLLAVLFGSGRGQFNERLDFVGKVYTPVIVRLGDLNADGRPDILAQGDASNVTTFLNEGGRRFGEPVRFGTGTMGSDFLAADFDGDGVDEVAALYAVPSGPWDGVSLLANPAGDGNLAASRVYLDYNPIRSSGWRPLSMAGGDFDGDRDLDLVIADRSDGGAPDDGVSILLNDGHGAFDERRHFVLDQSRDFSALRHVLPADVDRDGALDVVAITASGFRVLRSDGHAGLTEVLRHEKRGESGTLRGVVADFDGDGELDIATANTYEPGLIYWNEGGLLFGTGEKLPIASDGSEESQGRGALDIAGADFDGDGDTDVAALRWNVGATPVLDVLRNEGGRQFTPWRRQEIPEVRSAVSVVAADLDGDQAVDLAIGLNDGQSVAHPSVRYGGRVAIFRNAGDGRFEETSRDLLVGTPGPSVLAVDVDGDMDNDIVTANGASDSLGYGATGAGNEEVKVFLNNGDGRFKTTLTYLSERDPVAVVAEDLDGDGQRDLAIVGNKSEVSILLNRAPDLTVDGAVVTTDCTRQGFRRGDVNQDEAVTQYDAYTILQYLFLGLAEPRCLEACDVDDNGVVSLTDAVYLISYAFFPDFTGLAPPPPLRECGQDPTPDSLTCKAYLPCPY